jgi:hypothetical protein
MFFCLQRRKNPDPEKWNQTFLKSEKETLDCFRFGKFFCPNFKTISLYRPVAKLSRLNSPIRKIPGW